MVQHAALAAAYAIESHLERYALMMRQVVLAQLLGRYNQQLSEAFKLCTQR
jgi:hypothetical protein